MTDARSGLSSDARIERAGRLRPVDPNYLFVHR
jgi:hypothetical protein